MSDTKFSAVAKPNAASGELGPKKAGNVTYADSEDHLADGTYLRVEKDAMTAWLYLAPPKEGQNYSKDDLIRFLQKGGVKNGLHSSNLSAIIGKRVYNREIIVAQGRKTIDGKDGYFEYFSETERSEPEISEDGALDYTDMSIFRNVSAGDKAAIYHPAVQGADGYTMFGAKAKARPGRDLPHARGTGILREKNEYFAKIDGKIEAKEGKPDIQKTYEIPNVPSVELKPKKAGDVIYADSEDHLTNGTYLRVEKDAMAAWLYLAPPEEGQNYSKADLIRFLQNKGINSGLHSSNLSAIIRKRVYNREIIVAQGRETIDGEDGYFEYFFPTERRAPEIREDGTVDYTKMSALQNVHEGDKVAIYHPAVQGVDGYTVFGAEVKAKRVKDLPYARGKGILRENNEYFAQIDGKIEAKDGKIDIQKVHEVYGDVTLIVGKVEFLGDVIIHGNVESGVTINAGRNIEVRGTTGNATLYAYGDVILSRGIQGGGKISARGSVYADFIENTMVEAEGMVQSNTILNAQVYAKDKVITTGKKGCIIGGYAHGSMGIRAVTVGSDAEVRTILHCGYGLEDYEALIDLRHQEAEMKERLEELTESMTKALYGGFMRGPGNEMSPSEWKKMKATYLQQLESIGMERERLEKIVERSQGVHIRVEDYVHRNVIIGINAEQMMVNNTTRSMKYSADKGAIEASVL